MNYGAMRHYLGLVLRLEAACMLPSLGISLYHGEAEAARGFLFCAALIFSLGFILGALPWDRDGFHIKEGLILGSVCWISMAIFGALPFWMSGEIPSFIDSLFESVSGFTTTAASVVQDVEALPRGLIFWRGFILWLGGMGVIVLLIAAISTDRSEKAQYFLQSEVTGPLGVRQPLRFRELAKLLYCIYIGLTFLEVIFLLLGGMPLFDSVVTAMATSGTGGFSARNMSIAAYSSTYIEIVITVFMVLCGANYMIHYFLITRNFAGIRTNDEIKAYVGVITASSFLVAVNIYGRVYPSLIQSMRYAVFQTVSMITTTGFLTADISLWPQLSKTLLFFLIFIGACSVSSGGGLKIARVVILCKEARRALMRAVRPRSVEIVRFNAKQLDKTSLHAINTYFVTYLILFCLSFLLISLDNLDFSVSMAAVAACMNNVGGGLGIMSQACDYGVFSPLGKIVLMIDMLIGRLEIYPVLLLFSPRTWRGI